MLNTLRRIVQQVNEAQDLDQALQIIVRQVKRAISADVCSVYLKDPVHNQLVLMATDGLLRESVGQVRIAVGEGLVGWVAERADPLNLDNAPLHPRYRFFSETGEQEFQGFFGVPIIHHREVLGVLVAQLKENARFSHDRVNFLVTIAAQLSGAIAHAQAVGLIPSLSDPATADHRPLSGLPGSPGVAIGTAVNMDTSTTLDSVPEKQVEDTEGQQTLFSNAIEKVKEDISLLSERMLAANIPAEDLAIFDAYRMMLDSDSFVKSTENYIDKGHWAPGALRKTIEEHIALFREMDSPYLRERMDDIRDLGQRILNEMIQSRKPRSKLPKNAILVGSEITATQLAEVEKGRVVGIVSAAGSRTSHVSILARALGIPAVMGVSNLPASQMEGCKIIADGYSGKVYISPPVAVLREYKRLAEEEQSLCEELRELRDKPAETPDGVRIPLYANTGLIADLSPSIESGAEGIGLYRTEYPFMIRQRFPGEEEQSKIYREVLASFAPGPVVLRTLDIGGDKSLPYFPIEEDNPFLGWRGIRVTLDHPEIFVIQLRAMLIASQGLDNLNILFPMISSVSEVCESIELLKKAHAELKEEGVEVAFPKVGVMVEVPAAVFQIAQLAEKVDFFSVGTNDLIQYLLAVDRNNSQVADLYESLHPAVVSAIKQVVDTAHQHGVPVSVCGEMAGDPVAALLLLGMGIDSLSMNVSSLSRIKWVIRQFSTQQAKAIVEKALSFNDAREIRIYLMSELDRVGMGGLFRAGR